jgi:hypothetical protein
MTMKSSAEKTEQRKVLDPSVDDYIAFHGMFCSPFVARQCIDSFDGSAFFANKNYYESGCNLEFIDYSRRRFFRLKVFTYYLLVLVTFTGLCSLFGQTKLTAQRKEDEHFTIEDEREVQSNFHEDLQVPPHVIAYILKTSQTTELVLKQRFEYDFGTFFSVIMLHFVCSNGRKHLVEVYKWNHPLVGLLADGIIGLLIGVNAFFQVKQRKVE